MYLFINIFVYFMCVCAGVCVSTNTHTHTFVLTCSLSCRCRYHHHHSHICIFTCLLYVLGLIFSSTASFVIYIQLSRLRETIWWDSLMLPFPHSSYFCSSTFWYCGQAHTLIHECILTERERGNHYSLLIEHNRSTHFLPVHIKENMLTHIFKKG